MPWTASARRQYARPAERYATDLTDAEFALVAPHLPAPSRVGRPAAGGRPARGARRDPLPAADRLPLAPPAQGLPAQEHGLWLLPAPLGGRHVADAPRPAGPGRACASRAGGLAHGRHRRQPVGADDRERRPQAGATTPGRRSTAASGTSWSTRSACGWCSWSTPPTSRTATGWHWSAAGCADAFPGSG